MRISFPLISLLPDSEVYRIATNQMPAKVWVIVEEWIRILTHTEFKYRPIRDLRTTGEDEHGIPYFGLLQRAQWRKPGLLTKPRIVVINIGLWVLQPGQQRGVIHSKLRFQLS